MRQAGTRSLFVDVLTGSGILVIASAKLGAEKVYGADKDPPEEEIARDNLLVHQDHTVPNGQELSFLMEFHTESQRLQGLSNIYAIGIHGRARQMGV
jgi:ribosomal protein L11 methylase PrmA